MIIKTRDSAYEKVSSNMMEVRARKGRIIAIASEGDTEVKHRADHVLYVPTSIPMLQPILSVIPLQLLAYYVAVSRGCDGCFAVAARYGGGMAHYKRRKSRRSA